METITDEHGNVYGLERGTRATLYLMGGASIGLTSDEIRVVRGEDGDVAFNFGNCSPRIGWIKHGQIAAVVFHDEEFHESASW